MTDRRHAGEDIDVPGLEDVLQDTDSGDEERAGELIEGLLGADAVERDDIPDRSVAEPETGEGVVDPSLVQTTTGRWVCRFCGTERRHPAGAITHHAIYPDSQHYRNTHWGDESEDGGTTALDAENDPGTTESGGETPGEQRTFLIDTQWHEFRGYLKFARHGLDPYYALHSLMRRSDWSDGPPTRIIEYDDRKYEVEFTYQESGLKPWDDDTFRIENVREFQLELKTADGLRKASFNISPRWPNTESKDGMATPSNPRDFIGVDVDIEGQPQS